MGFTPPNGGVRGASVSIPFIAGQWSLNASPPPHEREGARFQSPSLRGSGRFGSTGSRPRCRSAGFQSPSLRGSGRFPLTRGWGRAPGRGFNPLHCGAVVAWVIGVGDAQRRRGFNPLHCGAVVASRPRCGVDRRIVRVSIPFIAGQWSLRWRSGRAAGAAVPFQSPSLRGSGRFRPTRRTAGGQGGRFNPLHCGAVVASLRSLPRKPQPHGCFNPLHCGAVVASA